METIITLAETRIEYLESEMSVSEKAIKTLTDFSEEWWAIDEVINNYRTEIYNLKADLQELKEMQDKIKAIANTLA